MIAVPAIDNRSEVDIDDVALLQHGAIGDSVTNHFVNARADALGKALITETSGDMPVVERVFVDQPVDFIGGDAGNDLRTNEVHELGIEPPGGAQAVPLILVINRDRRDRSLATHDVYFPMMDSGQKPRVPSAGCFRLPLTRTLSNCIVVVNAGSFNSFDRARQRSIFVARPLKRKKKPSGLMGSHQRCWIWGRMSVVETLRAARWPILDLHLSKEMAVDELHAAMKLADGLNLPVSIETPEELTRLCRSEDHQGYLAKMPPFPYDDAEDVLSRRRDRAFYLVLDAVQDPFNFGAILRSADALGVDGVFVAVHPPVRRDEPRCAIIRRSRQLHAACPCRRSG